MNPVLVNLTCAFTLVPAALLSLRREPARDLAFWGALGLALAGAGVWVTLALRGAWPTGFAATLWLTIAATLALFCLVALMAREAWRLAPLLMPYLVVLAALATVWAGQAGRPLQLPAPHGWLEAHIALSLLTYGLLTIAAVAGCGLLLQDRALKARRPTRLTRLLPSIAAGEKLEGQLLLLTEVVLALGILSGVGAHYLLDGRPLSLDHKTLLTLIAFAFIGALLVSRRMGGVRGRQGARYVLAAYLLVTLAYPGVKFVTDVLVGRG